MKLLFLYFFITLILGLFIINFGESCERFLTQRNNSQLNNNLNYYMKAILNISGNESNTSNTSSTEYTPINKEPEINRYDYQHNINYMHPENMMKEENKNYQFVGKNSIGRTIKAIIK